MGSLTDQVGSKVVIRLLQHIESLSEAKVTHDIKGEVVAPVRHILGLTPSLLLAHDHAIVLALGD